MQVTRVVRRHCFALSSARARFCAIGRTGVTRAFWRRFAATLFLIICTLSPAHAQVLQKTWIARWIADADAPSKGAGVFHFRKRLDLAVKPEHFRVRVSADNRYRLFVNGAQVSVGPARSDIMHWRYETVDLAPYLRTGTNIVGATVWNWGELRPGAQISRRTAFLIQSESSAEAAIDSGPAWKVFWDRAYQFSSAGDVGGYYAAAPGEGFDARLYPWGWEQPDFDDRNWSAAAETGSALSAGAQAYGDASDWQLAPRAIPPTEERRIRFAKVRRAIGIKALPGFLKGKAPLTIPANSKVSLLLDQGEMTMGYPVVLASGGRGATATLTFAEGMFDAQGHKRNRNEIVDKTIKGISNRITFDGRDRRRFQSLWLRAWRYVQIDIETRGEPLRLDDASAIFTGYPFEQRAGFRSDQAWIGDIWDIDWRTFRLSAFETFWDTPYYEQFQYVGDSRIESLISLYNSGDDRLMRNAIEQFDASRIPDGITASRYPSAMPQYIPPFSLWWVAMVNDHWLYRGDADFARRFLPGVRGVIGWYERELDGTGQLGPMPWWNFVDWTFERGVPPGAADGHSTAISLQFAYVLRLAADLERGLGSGSEADHDLALAERINAAVRAQSWDSARGLFADTPEKRRFSQQTNALAILSGAASDRRAVAERMLADKTITQASYYFRFYVDEALQQSGLADRYLHQLEPWREMLRLGLTTTLEEREPSRSDSHAWSAHPNYHLLATVLGIRPAEPGFRSVTIAPALGGLKQASGHMPTPAGNLAVRFRRRGATGITGRIDLPPNTRGTFIWNGNASPLKAGQNNLRR
jgi:alpha-L-rhamnosidase